MTRRAVLLLALAGLAVAAGLWAWRRAHERRAERARECAQAATRLDRELRGRFPRAYEGLEEHRLVPGSGRCMAVIEYHYRPCDAKERAAAPKLCAGPEADIGVYDVWQARLLLSCEKRGEALDCGQPVYGPDGRPRSFGPIPTHDFPRLKARLLGLP